MTATQTADTIGDGLKKMEKLFSLDDIELEPDYTPPPIDYSRYQRAIQGEDLPPFCTEGVHPSVKQAHVFTRLWARAIRKNSSPYWLTLFGSSGCGKTFLARHARSYLRKIGIDCQLWNWAKAFPTLVSPGENLTPHLCNLPVLILDDIGTGYTLSDKAAELHSAKLYEILEARINMWTFLTSNLNPQQLREKLDARIASRLFRGENEMVDLTQADDYCYLQKMKRRCKH